MASTAAPITDEAFARKVETLVPDRGFMEILELIGVITPIIKSLPCFKKAAAKQKMTEVIPAVESNIAESFRATRRKKADRLHPKVAAAMKELGYRTKKARHEMWDRMNEVAFDESPAVAAALSV